MRKKNWKKTCLRSLGQEKQQKYLKHNVSAISTFDTLLEQVRMKPCFMEEQATNYVWKQVKSFLNVRINRLKTSLKNMINIMSSSMVMSSNMETDSRDAITINSRERKENSITIGRVL